MTGGYLHYLLNKENILHKVFLENFYTIHSLLVAFMVKELTLNSILASILTRLTKRILMYLQICHGIQKAIALYEF